MRSPAEYVLSEKLGTLFVRYQAEAALDLRSLVREILVIYETPTHLCEIMQSASVGSMAHGTLLRHLADFVQYDSVVRDIYTVGHVAKLLSRMDVFLLSDDSRIFGLPNVVFDSWSQIERSEHFVRGKILPIDAQVLQLEKVREMLQREEHKGVKPA